MVEAAVDAAAIGRADHDRAAEVAVGAVADAGRLADDLVEGGVDEVGELDLGDRDGAVHGGPDGDADDARLGERRVEIPCLSETVVEALGGQEDATLAAHVLAQHPDPLVSLHLFQEGFPDPGDERLLGHPAASAKTCLRVSSASGEAAASA